MGFLKQANHWQQVHGIMKLVTDQGTGKDSTVGWAGIEQRD